jgi:hypothetical protein
MYARTKPTSSPSLKKKKRGAPPGNQNALKHGFYSRRFRNLEMGDLDVVTADLIEKSPVCEWRRGACWSFPSIWAMIP